MALVSLNTYDEVPPAGVPNPFGPRVHAYPTRYHGPVYTRPMFRLDWMPRPNDFGVPRGTAGLGQEEPPPRQAPTTNMECDHLYPVPEVVTSAEQFAAYLQNQSCKERVRQASDSRRWLIGLGLAMVVGAMMGRGM